MELSTIATAVSATGFLSDLSLKREMISFSSPSVVRSSLKRCEKEKEPVRETMPDPVRDPLARSLESMPLPERVQKSVVPGLTFLVLMVVVNTPPSFGVDVDVISSAFEALGSNAIAAFILLVTLY